MHINLKQMQKNIFKIIVGAYVLFGISVFCGVIFVNASENQVPSRVVIINPLGADIGIKAVPEKRIPNIDARVLNRSSFVTVKLFSAGADRTDPDNVVTSTIVQTNDAGTYEGVWTLVGIPQGQYDATAKTNAHLTRLLPDVDVVNFAELDFTSDGTNPLKSGDINLEMGDDKVNALDISILVNNWGQNHDRADLNKDDVVNSLDASNLITNFNQLGD